MSGQETDIKTVDGIQAATQGNENRATLGSLFLTFLKIGLTAFGGFMALISVVQNYAVERKKMLTHDDMLDGVSLASVLPGPVAVNVVAYAGYRSRGIAGAIVSAVAVIFPSFALLVVLSHAYFKFGNFPVVEKLFQGFIPAVAAIILATAGNMAAKAVKGLPELFLTLASAALLLGVGGFWITLFIIVCSGLAGLLLFRQPGNVVVNNFARKKASERKEPGAGWHLAAFGAPASAVSFPGIPAAVKLLVVFAGMSFMLFGGGYVFIPLIQRVVVDGYGWVTRQEFIDAIALGQVTPGPILISAAFIGYKVAGLTGAAAATVGIFTPPAALMLICTRFLDNIKSSVYIQAALRGIRPAVIGMIGAAAVAVAKTAVMNWATLLIFAMTLVALLRFKVETAWIIPAAGVTGLFLY